MGEVVRSSELRDATATLLAAVTSGLSSVREPRAVRQRFEDEVKRLVRATTVTFREAAPTIGARPHVVCCAIPSSASGPRSCLEAVFEPGKPVDDRSKQLMRAAAPVAALLLEIERANGRWPLTCARSRPDGAAPLIGSSPGIRRVRERIEKVAATDFTILIEGASGAQSHLGFIEIFGDVAVHDGDGEVAGAREAVLLTWSRSSGV